MGKPPKETNSKIAVTFPKMMLEALQDVAEKKGQTISSIIRLAAAEYLEREMAK